MALRGPEQRRRGSVELHDKAGRLADVAPPPSVEPAESPHGRLSGAAEEGNSEKRGPLHAEDKATAAGYISTSSEQSFTHAHPLLGDAAPSNPAAGMLRYLLKDLTLPTDERPPSGRPSASTRRAWRQWLNPVLALVSIQVLLRILALQAYGFYMVLEGSPGAPIRIAANPLRDPRGLAVFATQSAFALGVVAGAVLAILLVTPEQYAGRAGGAVVWVHWGLTTALSACTLLMLSEVLLMGLGVIGPYYQVGGMELHFTEALWTWKTEARRWGCGWKRAFGGRSPASRRGRNDR